jgi:hypothetical protein
VSAGPYGDHVVAETFRRDAVEGLPDGLQTEKRVREIAGQ